MTSASYQKIALQIPHQPGIYKYYDDSGLLLYVGKAKDLRKRVGSYFLKNIANQKTYELIQRIHKIEFTIVDSEHDAFLLENALIKEYQPRYNISLKDGKTYPYIVIKQEPFPRVFFTRKKIMDKSEYIGPFTSSGKVKELLDFVRSYIPLRTCKLNLTEKNIQSGKFKVCLEYHLGNCKGPCENLQSKEAYAEGLEQVKNILKGNLSAVIAHFKQQMQAFAKNMDFENAAIIKKKIEGLENYQSQSVIVNKKMGAADVFSIVKEDDLAYVNYLMIENGTIVQTHTVPVTSKLNETDAEVLAFAVATLRNSFNSMAHEIIVPFTIELPDKTIRITIPKSGDKKKLLDLSLKNVNYYQEALRRKKMLHLEEKTPDEKTSILRSLQHNLQLKEIPDYIECFDNSHFQGSFPVSAMVCFKNGEPSKADYRRFNVKTVVGIDDFATMREVVFRRYKRLLEENQPLPKLIIIDGGKGQLNAALESISALNLQGKIALIGLAKNEEEIFFPRDQHAIRLPWNSDDLKLIRRIRDEVHNFVINFHRNKRSKGAFDTTLDNIKGIGKPTVTLLLKEFKSVKGIKSQPIEKITALIGPKKAILLFDVLRK